MTHMTGKPVLPVLARARTVYMRARVICVIGRHACCSVVATVLCAKQALKIESAKSGLTDGWQWSLPEDAQPRAEDAQPTR